MRAKYLLRLLCVLMLGLTVFSVSAKKKEGKIKFSQTSYNFGTIKEDGGKVSHVFEFKNEGEGNLVITSARAECGCTKPEYSDKPIAPGKTGTIKVTYNPLGRPGAFTKSITVRTNGSPGKVVLKIKGTVKPFKRD